MRRLPKGKTAQVMGSRFFQTMYTADQMRKYSDKAVSDEREQVAAWMMQRGYATGHGDTVEGLLKELEWQVAEREREACAKVCEELFADVPPYSAPDCAAAIRERGQA